MSRLDINIRRLQAQRACLNLLAEQIHDLPGPIFELGLGNGRTYDHLRELLPGREIFVFDREVAAHPDCIPDEAHLFLGDFQETLPHAIERFAGTVALIHADIGSANAARDARLAGAIAEFLPALLRPGGVVASDRDVVFAGAAPVPVPASVAPDAYFLYRREAGREPAVVAAEG
ncbi:MAG: class I SAM-dependent methyltransferase [Alphaproteobacteria bacterium]